MPDKNLFPLGTPVTWTWAKNCASPGKDREPPVFGTVVGYRPRRNGPPLVCVLSLTAQARTLARETIDNAGRGLGYVTGDWIDARRMQRDGPSPLDPGYVARTTPAERRAAAYQTLLDPAEGLTQLYEPEHLRSGGDCTEMLRMAQEAGGQPPMLIDLSEVWGASNARRERAEGRPSSDGAALRPSARNAEIGAIIRAAVTYPYRATGFLIGTAGSFAAGQDERRAAMLWAAYRLSEALLRDGDAAAISPLVLSYAREALSRKVWVLCREGAGGAAHHVVRMPCGGEPPAGQALGAMMQALVG